MELFILFFMFAVSLFVLLKAAAWFGAGAVTVFGAGKNSASVNTAIVAALPELALALAAVSAGRPDLVVPIVIGSSIANILLVVGIVAFAAKVAGDQAGTY